MIFYSHYKRIRKEYKISLEDISRRTKIDIKYLKALESGKENENEKGSGAGKGNEKENEKENGTGKESERKR